ncbi:MAG: hypothetical protein IPQ16_07130 [Geobacteraceae bacterium]|nr:hypothetical protein [Geobacteraceae bacterium]
MPEAPATPAGFLTRWETKRGSAVRGTRGWDLAMLKAKGQAREVEPGSYAG